MFRKLLLTAFAAVTALAVQPASSAAQKALVYCPTGADAGGCARVVTAIASKFAAVDRAYDGTDGTIDLRTADLAHYAVIVVPSLADAGDRRPYELLRGQAARIKLAVTGRVAVFSGAPDQGAANREAKDAVIANLVGWAAEGHTRPVGLVGLVAFQDLSDDAASRYDWVAASSPVEVTADVELKSFRSVKTQATVRSSFFRKGDAELAYPNMASYGLHIGKNAAARTISAAVGGDAGQTVLVTYGEPGSTGPQLLASVAGGDTAWIATDKPNYLPGDTVTFTGGNWAPGDTVKVTVHEDPHWVPEHQDRYIVAIAGQDGKFLNRDFVIHTNDFGVTFTATAVGTPSGKTAQHVFTDGGLLFKLATVDQALPASPAPTWTVHWTKYTASNNCSSGPTSSSSTTIVGSVSAIVDAVNLLAGQSLLVTSVTAPANYQINYWSATDNNTPLSPVCRSGNNSSNNNIEAYAHFKINVSVTAVTATASTYGGTTDLSATIVPATAGSVAFYVNGSATAIPATYNAGTGVATVAGHLHGLNASATAYPVRAVFTPSAGPAVEATNASALLVGKAATTTTVTCTGGPFVYNTAYHTPCSATVTGPGGLNAPVTPVNYEDHRSAGTATASASYAETANYLGSSDTENFTIGKATTTVTLTCPVSVPYTGAAQTPCSASAQFSYGVTATMTPSYSNNVNVGTATATATYVESANHLGDSKTANFDITPVSVTASITASGKPYDGTTNVVGPVGCSVSGVLSGDAANVGCTASGAAFDLADAGSRTVTATVALTGAAAGNYALSSTTASVSATITKINATINVSGYSGEYDGNPHGASGTATGIGGVDLGSLLTLGASYTNVPGGTANWSFAGNTNYNAANGSVSIVITKAPSVTDVTCTAGPFVYNAAPHTPCAVSVTGVGGLSLNPAPTYANNVDAGSASASYTYAGDGNHNGSSDSQTFTIAKANQTITWANPANIVYGTALSGTQLNASVAGVAGGSAPGALTYTPASGATLGAGSHSLQVDAAATSNYLAATKTVTLVVDKKPVTPSVTAQNKTYDGTTTATITGCTVAVKVGSDDVACSEAAATFADKHYGVGKTVTATGIALTGGTAGNYSLTATTATTTANIDRAPLTITADNKSKIWNGTPFTAFTATYSGLVTGDHTANVPNAGVLTGTLSFSGNATTAVDAGTYTITPGGYATPNGNYTISYANGTLTIIDQTAPKATITELNPVQVGTAATLKVNVTDVTTGNSNITEWRYTIDGGAATTLAVSPAQPNVNVNTTLPVVSTTDVQTICVEGKDAGGNWSLVTCALLAVYDPTAGFVTGGGWIDSPAGAYKENASLTGRANFGFVAKYQRGATTPTGHTEFQFHGAGLNFKSSSYEWLVVQGTTQAQFKGDGTIAGRSGVYGFILTIVDGDNFGQKKPDTFRMKIVDKATGAVVYDNVNTTDDTAPAVAPINGGSIQIQAK